jgi:hypothetical protein
MSPTGVITIDDLEYQGVLGRNWLSPWVEGGKYCGSRGMALPLLGLKVRLKGDAAQSFECTYSATFIDGTAIGPVSAGETCEAESLAPLEAFQILIRPRGSAKPAMKEVKGADDKKAVTDQKPKAVAKPVAKHAARR